MGERSRYSAEVRDRAVRLVIESAGSDPSQWAAITSVASKIGGTAETLRSWVRQAERDLGKRAGLTSGERDRLKERGKFDAFVEVDAAFIRVRAAAHEAK